MRIAIGLIAAMAGVAGAQVVNPGGGSGGPGPPGPAYTPTQSQLSSLLSGLYDPAGAAAALSTALGVKGSANGVASLDGTGKVPIAQVPSIPSTQVTGLGAAATHGATITISGTACSLDGTCTVAGGGATAPTVSQPTAVMAQPGGTFAVATPQSLYNVLATDTSPSESTYRTGTAGPCGTVNCTPAANTADVELYMNSSGAPILDANGLAQLAVHKSDGSQTAIGGPLTFAAIHAAAVAADPNCANSQASSANFIITGHCTLPAGSTPQFVASSNNVGLSGNGAQTVTHSNAQSGALNVVWLTWYNGGSTATQTVACSESGGSTATATAVVIGTGSDNGTSMASCAFANVSAGSQVFTATITGGSVSYEGLWVDEFSGANATTPVEGYTSGVNGSCGTLTTTGTNRLGVVFTDATSAPAGYTEVAGPSYGTTGTISLTTAGSTTPNVGSPLTCLALAVRP